MRRTKQQPRFRLDTEGTRKGKASKENGMRHEICIITSDITAFN